MYQRWTHKLVRPALVFSSMMFFNGCLIEPGASSRADTNPDATGSALTCRYTYSTGCLEAAIPPAPEVTVNGRAFFDANDLAAQFGDLIREVAPAEQLALIDQGGDIEFMTRIDNRAFHKGFQIFVKGEAAKSADALATGGFMVHRLPEGAYNVRVQKDIRYLIKPVVPAEVFVEGLHDAGDPVFCATIYAEANVEVRAQERLKFLFDDYELRVNKGACERL